jgi:hypothetical protein
MKKTGFDPSRRKLLLQLSASATAIAALPALPVARFFPVAHAEGKLSDLRESELMAASLGYHRSAAKVDAKKWPKRSGASGKKQFCDNCSLYTAVDKAKGKCTIFQGKLVEAKGWCNTWSQKA